MIQKVIDFCVENKTTLIPVLLLVVSEVMPLIKSAKAKGIIQFVLNIIVKKNG